LRKPNFTRETEHYAKDIQLGPEGLAFKKAYVEDESGATAIEYGLIAAGIAVTIMIIVGTLGGTLQTMFTSINTQLAGSDPV
jgi:pilus assembly protein Flp/PilA